MDCNDKINANNDSDINECLMIKKPEILIIV